MFENIFDKYDKDLVFEGVEDLSNKIKLIHLKNNSEKDEIRKYLFDKMKNSYSLENLIKRISDIVVR